MFKVFVLLFVMLLLLSGCGGSYYVVKSSYIKNDMQEKEADVVSTKIYKEKIGNIKKVMLKAPDACINETASESTGKALLSSTVLKTQCGIEMDMLERTLAKKGYQVISWKSLRNQGGDTLKAARKLKAEVLFQINSIERGRAVAASNERWDRRYYKSNRKGDVKGPKLLSGKRADQLDYLANYYEKKSLDHNKGHLNVILNASLIYVKTGQAIWFYEWVHAENSKNNLKIETHAHCKSIGCFDAITTKKSSNDVRSGSSNAISVSKQPKDYEKAKYNDLLKEAVNDLVDRFSSGR